MPWVAAATAAAAAATAAAAAASIRLLLNGLILSFLQQLCGALQRQIKDHLLMLPFLVHPFLEYLLLEW
jgi:hypothetical protein